MGAMARQGPHQAAQKSTNTGCSDFSTSWSKFESVTSTIPFPAIVPPTPNSMDCYAFILAPLFDAILVRKSQEDNCRLSALSSQLVANPLRELPNGPHERISRKVLASVSG